MENLVELLLELEKINKLKGIVDELIPIDIRNDLKDLRIKVSSQIWEDSVIISG